MSIAHVDTGAQITKIPVNSPTFSIAWHPKRYLLAYACDDKDKYVELLGKAKIDFKYLDFFCRYDRDRDSGSLKIWGFPSDD